jgi:hypothetical protein
MKKLFKELIISLFSILVISCTSQVKNGPAKVELKQKDGKYRLYVNGNEFYVKGAGCEFGNIEKLGESGANSFRTWRTENGQSSGTEILNRAQKSNLMVLMGLELIPDRKGFDYNDKVAVARQFDSIKAQVLKYKDHPAILGWCIGNELNLFYKNPAVWDAVEDVAKFIHQVDPNHVTTTALSGIGKGEIDEIRKRCPDLDFVSIQMYGDIINLQQRIKDAGYEGPYMVTEWGATGHWESPMTKWNAAIEQTSTEKAKSYTERFVKAIQSDTMRCLGSYVFLWGQKQERTPTWYGMFTEEGNSMETVDAMYKIWNGKEPANRCPRIDSISVNGLSAIKSITVQHASLLKAYISAVDLEGDTIKYKYEIMPESTDLKTGGDFETKPVVLEKIESQKNTAELKAPEKAGAYRLLFYALDGKGHCGTANIPFYVK